MSHLHENSNLLSSLDPATIMFFSLWIFSQLMRYVPKSWMTKYLSDSDCCEMQQERYECREAQEKPLRIPWSKAAAWRQIPLHLFLRQLLMPSGWGGLTNDARAADGKRLHSTSFPLWVCFPGHPVGSMENASAYQHSMPLKISSSFTFP